MGEILVNLYKIWISVSIFWLCVDDKVPCELQYLELPLHSKETCRNTDIGQRYLFTAAKHYPEIQICAGNLDGGKDACQVWQDLIYQNLNLSE